MPPSKNPTPGLPLPNRPETVLRLAEKLLRLKTDRQRRTCRDIARERSAIGKKDALHDGISIFVCDTNRLVREALEEYSTYATKRLKVKPSRHVQGWAKQQVYTALAHSLGIVRFVDDESCETRPSRSAKSLFLLCAKEWIGFACDDPRDGFAKFVQWRAPLWACLSEAELAETFNHAKALDELASKRQTHNLIVHLAAQIHSAFADASSDVFDPAGLDPEPPRKKSGPKVQAKTILLRQILSQDENMSAKRACDRLDNIIDKDRQYQGLAEPTVCGQKFKSYAAAYQSGPSTRAALSTWVANNRPRKQRS
jgi:hypothetical protein